MFTKFRLLSKRDQLIWGLAVGGTALLAVAGVLWWRVVSLDPERVFWGTITNNMSTTGVTLQSVQQEAGTKTEQYLQLDFGPESKAHSLTTLTRDKAVVTTENLSTPKADYTRYLSIKKDGKENPKASSVIGKWADTTEQKVPRTEGRPPLFAQVMLSRALPLGDLSPQQRKTLLEAIRADNVYDTTFKNIKKSHHNGRLQYEYQIKLQPILYIRLMKTYAKLIGLEDLDKVDPNSYSGVPPITLTWTVDARSRQLVAVDYGNGRKETYSGYGLPVQTTVPKQTLSGTDLQHRLGQLQ